MSAAADQLDLFSEPLSNAEENQSPLIGLAVQLPSLCACGAVPAKIEAGRGPHLASLRCSACGTHRGWLSREAHRFVAEAAKKFGRPPGPIVIRTNIKPQPSQSGGLKLEEAPFPRKTNARHQTPNLENSRGENDEYPSDESNE
jgi:hypothetical protein